MMQTKPQQETAPFEALSRRRVLKLGLMGAVASAAVAGGRPLRAREQTELTIWCIAGPRFEMPQRALIPLFRDVAPTIDVAIVTGTWANFYQQVAVAVAGGTTKHDIIFHDYGELPALAETGGLASLDDYLAERPELKDVFETEVPESVRSVWQYKGRVYGIPPDANSQMMYWRRDVLDRAGIRVPKTWAEVIEAAQELTGGGRYGVAFSAQRGVHAFSVFASILWSHGGEIYDPESYQVRLNSHEAVAALELMKALVRYADPVSLNATNDEVIRSFGSGASVIAPCEWGGTGLTDPRFTRFAEVTGVRPVPRGSGPKAESVGLLGGLGFLIPARSPNKEAAMDWISFVLSRDEAVELTWVENTGQPIRLPVLRRYADTNPLFSSLAEALPRARPFPQIPEGTELKDRIGTQVSLVLTGEQPPDAAAEEMQRQISELFQRAGYL